MNELIPRIQTHQKKKDKTSRLLKSKTEDLDYDDYMYMEKYLCSRMRFFYHEKMWIDMLFQPPYTVSKHFDFTC